MATSTWTCGCGRRVPLAIDTCRCGAPRPEEAAGSDALPADLPGAEIPTAREEVQRLPGWVRHVATLAVVVGVYFGSRGCNRSQTSEEAREAAIEGLTEAVGRETAKVLVGKHHDKCFDETYQTGWGRRGRSKFDEEKYVRCLVRAVEADGRVPPAVRTVSSTERARPEPMRASTPTPAPAPILGRVVLGDGEVVELTREPSFQARVRFVAVGSPEAVAGGAICSHVVECNMTPRSQRRQEPCPLQADGPKGTGELTLGDAQALPADGGCVLRLAFVGNGGQLRSNELLLQLR